MDSEIVDNCLEYLGFEKEELTKYPWQAVKQTESILLKELVEIWTMKWFQ